MSALYVFAYAGLTGGTHLAITRELRAWPELKHGVVQDDALIERSRSKAASHFLLDEAAGDVMLMVDHDITWEPGGLRHIADLARETRGIVAGLYPKRAFHAGMTFRIDNPVSFRTGDAEPVPATFVSTGFIAIHREVVEHVASQMKPVIQGFYPMFLPMVVETEHGLEHLSEDWAFCHRAKPKPIHIAPKPALKHEGSYQYRMADSLVEPPDDCPVEITHLSARRAG